ncbi:methyltransferase domain-containing protein [Bradyrhizobium valentinum]|uniref:methyltransferase domain-containing protein n=1 Tax=Bradyrhizobium valentinum TaxID=1518501 RepID=UPI000708BAE7|nr:methyltransferase domain-containing protein [Bradyrhizobium valentinum]KRR13639.1 methyltransferase [Bradyrhizobium valentinum]
MDSLEQTTLARQGSATGDGIHAARAGWSFGGDTPQHFDRHVARSVPNYEAGHRLIEQVSDFFVKKDSVAYEIGTSTGTLLRRLAKRHPHGTRWIGIDTERAMIEYARSAHSKESVNVEYLLANACEVGYEASDFIVSYYTIQFVPPRHRQHLIDLVYKSLNWGGAFLFFEKVRAPDARFQDIMSAVYIDYKLDNGYSPEEVLGKASSLKGVLEPFSTNGNLDMLHRAGFVDTMTIYKHVCFEGFLAIK